MYTTKGPEVPRSGDTKYCRSNEFVNAFSFQPSFLFLSAAPVAVAIFCARRCKERHWLEKTELPEARTGTIFVAHFYRRKKKKNTVAVRHLFFPPQNHRVLMRPAEK